VKILILVLLISISSCNRYKKETEITSSEQIISELAIDKGEYVIIPFKQEWYWIFKNSKQTDLTQSDLNEIEGILQIAVKENNDSQKLYLEKHNMEYPKHQWTETRFELKLNGFRRQYVPVINESGEKEIWVNFFCNNWQSEKWKTEIIDVDDGGNCFFNLKINLTTKKYSDLRINGYA
jgi:hypothetical protein